MLKVPDWIVIVRSQFQFSCPIIFLQEKTKIISFSVSCQRGKGIINFNIKRRWKSLHLCQFIYDLYETFNLSSWGTYKLSQLVQSTWAPPNGYYKTWGSPNYKKKSLYFCLFNSDYRCAPQWRSFAAHLLVVWGTPIHHTTSKWAANRGRICWTHVQSLLRPPSPSSHEEAAKKTPLRTQMKTCRILYIFLLSSLHDLAYDSSHVIETVILKLSRW